MKPHWIPTLGMILTFPPGFMWLVDGPPTVSKLYIVLAWLGLWAWAVNYGLKNSAPFK